MMVTAVITILAVGLPSYLYLLGLPLDWAIALLVGFIAVAILGYIGYRQNPQ